MAKDLAGATSAGGGTAAASPSLAPGKLPLTAGLSPSAAPLDLRIHAPDSISTEIDEFRTALDRGDRHAAEWAWMRATEEARAAWGKSASVGRELVQAQRTLGVGTIGVMGQAGISFRGHEDLVKEILAGPHIGQYVDAIMVAPGAIMVTFFDELPTADQLDDGKRAQLGRILAAVNDADGARMMFRHLYGGVPSDTYDGSLIIHVRTWTAATIQRLHRLLSASPQPAHIRAAATWVLGYEWKKKKTDAEFQPLTGQAWWGNGTITLSEQALHTGKEIFPGQFVGEEPNYDHSNVGGANVESQAGDAGKGHGTLGPIEGTILHEVGHGVGDTLGGHAWAETHPFVGWRTGMGYDEWSKHLWGDDDALTQRAIDQMHAPRTLPAKDARLYMASSLLGAPALPAGWKREELENQIGVFYRDQPLTKYWRTRGTDEGVYAFPDTQNYGGDGRVYVLLLNGNGLGSYTQAAHQQKVSWYSLSAPHEWFAEQYTAYYHIAPRGSAVDPSTRTKLDELDAKSPPMPGPKKGDTLMPPEPAGGGERGPAPW